MQSEHWSLGFYQAQISKNPKLLTFIPRTSDDVLKLYLYYLRKKKKLDTAASEFILIFIFA